MRLAITELNVTGLTSDREMTCLARSRQKPGDPSVSNVCSSVQTQTSCVRVLIARSGELADVPRSLSLAGPVSHRGAQHGSPLEHQGHIIHLGGYISKSDQFLTSQTHLELLNLRFSWLIHILGSSEFVKFPVTAAIGGIWAKYWVLNAGSFAVLRFCSFLYSVSMYVCTTIVIVQILQVSI